MNLEKLNGLVKISQRILDATSMDYRRDIDVELGARLIMIKGFRGVGKTTYLLQCLKNLGASKKGIFLSLDHIFFSEEKLFYTIDALYDIGYRVFVLDEVHKYETWSRELKNIYDSFPDVHVWATSSSALDIYKSEGDLSRRADIYTMNGLSFREYLSYDSNIEIDSVAFDDLLIRGNDIYETYYTKHDLGRKFNAYLKKGYYPYYKELGKKYHNKILTTINQVVETDLPAIFKIDFESTRQIKKLLSVISRISPFTPNISMLSRDLSISRNSILKFIDILQRADVINVITSGRKSDSAMAKPDKILLNNTNILHALYATSDNIGTVRETFVTNALKNAYSVATPAKGDLLLDGKYTVEIGGKSKRFKQIYDMPNPVLIKDGIKEPRPNEIPMWMIGLI